MIVADMNVPNLFLVGAMKSATTSLWHYLVTHPEIYGTEWKELNCVHLMTKELEGLDKYLKLFNDAPDCRYLLDGSVRNLERHRYPDVAKRIKQLSPDAKIVVVLRDPFKRLVSHFRFCSKLLRVGSSLTKSLGDNEVGLLPNSCYPYLLEPYYEVFPSQNIHILTTEELSNSPLETMNALFSWLGLECPSSHEWVQRRHLVTPQTVQVLNDDKLFVRFYCKARRYRKVTNLLPNFARQFVRERLVAKKFQNARSDRVYLNEVAEAERYLAPLFMKSISKLEEQTGRSFDCWPSKHKNCNSAKSNLSRSCVWVPKELDGDLRWLDGYHERAVRRAA